MPKIQYRCTQYGECDKADNREPITLEAGEEPICPNPDCGKPLTKDDTSNGSRAKVPLKLLFMGLAIVAASIAVVLLWPRSSHTPTADVEQALTEVWPWLKASK